MNAIHVRRVTDPHEREQAFALRYGADVRERKLPVRRADHEHGILRDPLDPPAEETGVGQGGLLGAFVGRRLFGTGRYDFCDHPHAAEYRRWYRLADCRPRPEHRATAVTKLCVEKAYRRSRAILLHTTVLFEHGLAAGTAVNFIDATPLNRVLYPRLGYRQVFPDFHHPDCGRSSPMMLVMNDLEHLREVRSPFLRSAGAGIGPDCQSVAQFRSLIERHAAAPVPARRFQVA